MEEKVTFIEQRLGDMAEKIVTPVRVEDIEGRRFFEGTALWDTGAACTCIAKCVADALKLDTLPFGQMVTPIGVKPCDVGAILVFPGNVRRFIPMHTMVMEGAQRECDVIIGMDVIRRGDVSLYHDGEELVFRFDFGKKFKFRK